MNQILLQNLLLLDAYFPSAEWMASGKSRSVYRYKDIVIKVPLNKYGLNSNICEYDAYCNELLGSDLIPGEMFSISRDGAFLLCQSIIADESGSVSMTLRHYLTNRYFKNHQDLQDRIFKIIVEFERRGLVIGDINLSGIMVRFQNLDNFDLIVIDGFAADRSSMKTRVRYFLKFLRKLKTRKVYMKLIKKMAELRF